LKTSASALLIYPEISAGHVEQTINQAVIRFQAAAFRWTIAVHNRRLSFEFRKRPVRLVGRFTLPPFRLEARFSSAVRDQEMSRVRGT
jgi:hypothetical protein